MPQTIPSKMVHGATWMLGFRLLDRALAVFGTIVLARMLTPADFGLIAMATSVIALIELTGALSLEVALIQKRVPHRSHYDTTWTIRLLMGALVALLAFALATPAAAFYAEPKIAPLMWVLAGNVLVGGLENIGVVNFRRDLNFRREFLFLLGRRLVSLPVTLSLAVLYESYWALVIGTSAGTLTSVALSYVMHPFRPRLCLARWPEMLSFSSWMLALNLLAFLSARSAHFVIGRVHGAAALGTFTIANDFAALASSEITAPINRAVLPGLSRMAEQWGGLEDGLLRVTAATSLITMPAAFGMVAIAEPLVLVVLGEQWRPAIPVIQLLALVGALQSITANNHSAYLASGRPQIPVLIATVFVAMLIPLLLLLVGLGVQGAAAAHLIATFLAVVVSVTLMRRHLGTSLRSLAGVLWRPLVAALAMGVLVHLLDTWVISGMSALGRLIIGVASGVMLYVSALILIWLVAGRPRGIERTLLTRLRKH